VLLLDVNVVVAAHRADHPHHGLVRPWFDQIVSHRHDFGVPLSVWGFFLRLVTHRRIWSVPTPRVEAFEFIESTRAQHAYVASEPGPRHLRLLRELCEEGDAGGDLLPDAVLAAVAAEHGATIATLDHDFARFSSVPHLRPGSPAS
jgi:toxin-antitoxin system PIN domain toxin